MLSKVLALRGYALGSIDGDIGKAEEFYFDDGSWTVRYFVAYMGKQLGEGRVLISPSALGAIRVKDRRIDVELTRSQIEGCPSPNGGKLASRRKDGHLRSTRDAIGGSMEANDGDIGQIEDFLVDDEAWTIRYLVVDSRNRWPGKKVLIATKWIIRISWREAKVFVDLSRAAIEKSPEYSDEALPTRNYEVGLHRHYYREGYWI